MSWTSTLTLTQLVPTCAQKLREWRQGGSVPILDLRKAHLNVCVHKSLSFPDGDLENWRRYCLTRMGFGLNVVPAIIKIHRGHTTFRRRFHSTSDINIHRRHVNESIASVARIRHLADYGLTRNELKRLKNGAWLVYLEEYNTLYWNRGSDIPKVFSLFWETGGSPPCLRLAQLRHLLASEERQHSQLVKMMRWMTLTS